ncbi:MAG: Nif3-like dinuclear metal center hexameric protein, partial [Bifidobacteriaceae bacterium]|nr:Nif3-like dinuclear metal center hexameric protein [Bifidobacteriaceae bacterium]
TAHTNADAALGGVADALSQAIGVEPAGPLVPDPADPKAGIGRVGPLRPPATLAALAERLARALPPNHHGVRVAGPPGALVENAAVVGGSGDSLFEEVRQAGVDLYVTADLRHHPALEARERAEFDGGGKPYLLDVSHAASEWGWLARAADQLRAALAATGDRVVTWVNPEVADPWTARVDHAQDASRGERRQV